MADNDGKVLVQILVMARIDAKDDNEARVRGGDLARQIKAGIPENYDSVGVEVQAIGDTAVKTTAKSDEKATTTLKT